MKFTEYIRSHHVFAVEDLLAASDSPAAARQQLKDAVSSGAVERVRRGLYASSSGRFEGAGGIEEAVRSLSALPYLDAEKAAALALADSASMAARVEWLLEARSEAWHVPEDVLERLRAASAGTVSKLDKRAAATRGWSREWNMRLPEAEEEVASRAR